MDKIFSYLLIVSMFCLTGNVIAADANLVSSKDISEQERQVIDSVEKGGSEALPETGAGQSPDKNSDCE
ncbi:MAG: hypothetical protein P8Y20_08580 [Gammaproteobacteria bacterium]|jgi:hypothetical protein